MIKLKNILTEMALITKKGKTAYADDKPLKNLQAHDVKGNIVIMRQPHRGFFPMGYTIAYFMDTEEAANKIIKGEIPPLFFPTGTFISGGSPITDIWKKRFQKPGHEHILGVFQGETNDQMIFLNMLSVRPGFQRNTIASKLVDMIKKEFPNAKIKHSNPTDKGRNFLQKRGELTSDPEWGLD